MLIVVGKMVTYSVLHRWVYTVYLEGNLTGYLLTRSDDSDSFACLIVLAGNIRDNKGCLHQYVSVRQDFMKHL